MTARADSLPLSHKAINVTRCVVEPLVVASVCDHFVRRERDADRVIGALLGVVESDTRSESDDARLVRVTNCFGVPIFTVDGHRLPSIDKEYEQIMLSLNERANKDEQLVGWYSAGENFDEFAAVVGTSYIGQTEVNPVHLRVDTSLTDGPRLDVQAFVCSQLSYQPGLRQLATTFQPVATTVRTAPGDSIDDETSNIHIGLSELSRAVPDLASPHDHGQSQSGVESLELTLEHVLQRIGALREHVDDVVSGKTEGDAELGRRLTAALARLPPSEQTNFQELLTNNLQDLLMIVYLSNLTRAQLSLHERLHQLI